MAVGQSGRIVIEVDPELKKELYLALSCRGLPLKSWFLEQVMELLEGGQQLGFEFEAEDERKEASR